MFKCLQLPAQEKFHLSYLQPGWLVLVYVLAWDPLAWPSVHGPVGSGSVHCLLVLLALDFCLDSA